MTRQEHFNFIIERINLPENEKLKNYLNNVSEKNGIDIKWYFETARKCLNKFEQSTNKFDRAYYGINYDTYSRLFLEEMNKQGWK